MAETENIESQMLYSVFLIRMNLVVRIQLLEIT